MHNQPILNGTFQLEPQFIKGMIDAQQKYYRNREEESMKQLLCYYTDCVNYFQLKQQPISEYFQLKIKQLVKQIKQFGSHYYAQRNKQMMNKKIIRVMHEQNIQQHISTTLKMEQKINQKVNKIIEQQNLKLEKRLQKTKRGMGKCQSVMTMSFGSIDESSPESKKKPSIQTSKFLFTKQIYSDEQNSTS